MPVVAYLKASSAIDYLVLTRASDAKTFFVHRRSVERGEVPTRLHTSKGVLDIYRNGSIT